MSKNVINAVSDLIKNVGDSSTKVRSAITGDLRPEDKAEIEKKLIDLDNQIIDTQTKLNEIQASSTNWYIASSRPTLMWVGVLAFLLYFVIMPVVNWVASIKGIVLPKMDFDMESLMYLMLSMLGIGAMRTTEKIKGVQNKH